MAMALVGIGLSTASCAQQKPPPEEEVGTARQAQTTSLCSRGYRYDLTWGRSCFCPEYYGAVGDGVTDDTYAFQEALACAVSFMSTSYTYAPSVCMTRPTYKISSPLTIAALTDQSGALTSRPPGNLTILGLGPETNKILLTAGINVFHAESPDDGYCAPGPCDATTAKPLIKVRFERFGIEVQNGGFGIGIDMTGFNDSFVKDVAVTFDAPAFGVGIYMRGSTGLLKGRVPKGNRIDDLVWTSLPGPSSPALAYGVQLDPGDTSDLANGPINNRVFGGRFTGGNGGVRVNAGFANLFQGIETADIGAATAYGIDYDFGGGLGQCDAAHYPGGCVTNNTVQGGFATLGAAPVRYLARFQEGSRQNAVHAGYVRGIPLVEHDKEQEINGDSGNRIVLGASEILSVATPGATTTPFLKLTTADPFASGPATTHVHTARPSAAPNEPVVVVPNQSGTIQVGP